jgi:hypothetical protein
MHEPLSDKIIRSKRQPAVERGPEAHVEREVRLDPATPPDAVIRERIAGGFYHTPAVAEVVARRIVQRGDL